MKTIMQARVESTMNWMTSAAHMIRDNNKCILCRRCVAVCEKVQGIGVIGTNNRGFATFIGSAFDMGLGETSCVSCGQCIAVCPTGALYEKDYTDQILAAIADPDKYVVVQTAPVRPRRSWRGVRLSHGNRCRRKDGGSPAKTRL